VSPRTANPTARTDLIDIAARLLAEEGQQAMTVRRLASEVGTSTMAIYTQFGGMDELRRAVRMEGYLRLARHLTEVPPLRDPVAELNAVGYAYWFNAMENPNLYRAMFLEGPFGAEEIEVCAGTFQRLVTAVERCIAAGRFRPADSWRLATRFWTMAHGVISVVLAGLVGVDDATGDLTAMAAHLCAGFGDDPRAAERSVRRGHSVMQQRATAARAGSPA
jgi:AcrR family transcriptional regulator